MVPLCFPGDADRYCVLHLLNLDLQLSAYSMCQRGVRPHLFMRIVLYFVVKLTPC